MPAVITVTGHRKKRRTQQRFLLPLNPRKTETERGFNTLKSYEVLHKAGTNLIISQMN